MDLHTMKRKQLQNLCKQHKLPANLTNLEMLTNLSSLLQIEEKGKPTRRTRSCLKNSGEILSENDSDGLERKPKKVRFSPQNDVFELGNKKHEFVEYKRIERGKSKKKRDPEDSGDENEGIPGRVTRATKRASLGGKEVILSSPGVMKKRVKRVLSEDENSDKESHLVADLGCGLADEGNEVITVKSLRNRTFQSVLLPNKIVTMKNTQKQSESKNGDISKNKDAKADRGITQLKMGLRRSARNVKISKSSRKMSSGTQLAVNMPAADCEKGSISKVKNEDAHTISGKSLRKKGAKNTTSKNKDEVCVSNIVEMNECNAQPEKLVRRSRRNMEVTEDYVKPVVKLPTNDQIRKRNFGKGSRVGNETNVGTGVTYEDEHTVSRKKPRQKTRARACVEDGESAQPENVPRRSKRHVNPVNTNVVDDVKEETKVTANSDDCTRYQTRSGRVRMLHIKQGIKEELVSGNLVSRRNTIEKEDSSNQSIKSMLKKGSETKRNVRRSKRNASIDVTAIITKQADGSCSDVRKNMTRKRGRDIVLEEVPLQHTNRVDKLKRKKTVVVPSEAKSGENDSPHRSRELVVPKHSETESVIRRSKRNDLLATCTDSNITDSKKIVDTVEASTKNPNLTSSKKIVNTEEASANTPNLEDTKDPLPVNVAETSTSRSLKLQLDQELHRKIPVVQDPLRRLTRSALKGMTDRPAHVRGRISQKKSHSLSKLQIEASLPKAAFSASNIVKDRTSVVLQDSFEEVSAKPPNLEDPTHLVCTNEVAASPSFSVKLQTGQEMVNELCVSKDTPVVGEASSRQITRSAKKSFTDGPSYAKQKLSPNKSQSISKLQLVEVEALSPKATLTAEEPPSINVPSSSPEVARHTVDPVSSTSDMYKDNSARSMAQDSSAKTHEMTPYLQESRVLGLANIAETSSSERLKLQSIQDELLFDISASERAPVRSPASSDVQVSLLQVTGSSTGPVSGTRDICKDITSCATLQDSSAHTDSEAHFIHLEPVNESDAVADVVSIDRNAAADGFSSLEQITSRVTGASMEENKFVEPSCGVVQHVVVEGSTIHKEQSMDLLLFPENKCSTDPVSSINDVDKDDINQQDNSSEDNVASPYSTHMKPAGYSNVDHLTSTGKKGKPQISEDVESISREIDPNFGSEGAEVHGQQPSYQLSSPEVVGISDILISVIEEKKTESENINHDVAEAATVNEKEKKMESENINHDVAEAATVNEEKLAAEKGDGGPTGQENDICYPDAGFAECNGLEKDSGEASKEVGEATVDFTDGAVNMLLMEEKDDALCPEISAQAAEQHNTYSLSRTQEKEFLAPNSVLTSEEIYVLDSAFPTPEVSDMVTSLFSNKQLVEDIQQPISTPESCLRMEKICTSNRIEISNSKEVGDSVSEENKKSGPKSPSLLHATKVGDPVAEVNEGGEQKESASFWSSDIVAGRAAEDGNPLKEEQNTIRSANVSIDKDSEDEFEIKNEVNVLDFGDSISEGNMTSGLRSPSIVCATEVDHLVGKVNDDGEQEELPSLWNSNSVEDRAAEDGNSLQKEQNTVRPANVSADSIPKDSENEFQVNNEVNVLDSGDSVEGNKNSGLKSPFVVRATEVDDPVAEVNEAEVNEREQEEPPSLLTSGFVAGRAAEDGNSLQKEQNSVRSANLSVDNISKDDVDEFLIKNKVNVLGSSTRVVNHMKMSSEFSFDGKGYDGTGDMQEFVSVSQAFDDNFREGKCRESVFGTASSLKEMESREVNIEPINKGVEYKYDDNQTAGSASRRTSSSDSLKYNTIEESASACPLPLVIDEVVFEDDKESLKGKSSALIDDLVEDDGSYCKISDNVKADVVSTSVLEEDNYSNYNNDSHQSVKTSEQPDMSYWETSSQGKGIHQQTNERPSLVDVDDMKWNNNTDSIDITRIFYQEDDASGVPTEELPRKEYAMVVDGDAPAKLVSGSKVQTPTEMTNEARGYSDILNHDSECGPDQSFFYSDIFGPELKSFLRSDEMDEETSNSWSDRTNLILHNSVDIGKKHEEELNIVHNAGEEHVQAKGAGLVETQHAASDNHSFGDTAITPSEVHFKPGNENILQVSNSLKQDVDSTKTES